LACSCLSVSCSFVGITMSAFLGCVPSLPSDELSETAATYCEVQTGTATACDTMRWVGMIARRAGVVRLHEFSVPVSYVRNVTLGL
jgi:hypothetical protein